MAKKTSIAHTEVTLLKGPCDKKKVELVYPSPQYIMMGMGKLCYVKLNSTEFLYTEDEDQIQLLKRKESTLNDSTKN